ncbi:DUF3251 domain-containing protein [Calderihabitans maritimus]|uniref:Lipoprotein n=1 Tax=Calderihabitans maritimus TaxID=1246530 RepID=A0A1Z5HPE3_9FIRM|nr:DUF3251 domain-containing protein [Calderihabitans maritimus]GAW91191.1 lipoprotein [Calderihabitans maritimus]
MQTKINDIRQINDRLSQAEQDILDLKFNQKYRHRIAIIGTTPGGYVRLDSETGTFLVSVLDVVPYLDGFKVFLSIGNPSYATYNGFTLKGYWAKTLFSSFEKMDEGLTAFDSKPNSFEKKFVDELKPGSWNKVTLVVTPAKAEEFKYLILTIETDSISLFN